MAAPVILGPAGSSQHATSPKLAKSGSVLREGWSLHARLLAAADRPRGGGVLDQDTLSSWRRVVAPQQPGNFEKRLHWAGLTLGDAAWAFNPPDDAVPSAPPWLPLLMQLREACRDAPAGAVFRHAAGRTKPVAFEELFWPICLWAQQRLREQLAPGELGVVADAALDDLAAALLDRLSTLCAHALYEIFSEFRGIAATLMAGLCDEAAPSREQYLHFIATLRSDGMARLVGDFPVLGRLLSTVVGTWLITSRELLQRVKTNRTALFDSFEIPHEALLDRIDVHLGDAHRGGRCVAGLHFSWSGNGHARVVYKPRDMGVDAAYQACLAHLNMLAAQPLFRCVTISAFQGYGFMEFVEYQPCAGEEELVRFYRNAGRLLAVLYMLGCEDCHHENLIASGDQLIPIDTETLMQSDPRRAAVPDSGDEDLRQRLARSVLRVGFLPQWRFSAVGGHMRALDVSALGVAPLREPAVMQAGWVAPNSDEMHWGRVEVPVPVPTSCPVRIAGRRRLADYQDQIKSGFAELMTLLLQNKHGLLADGGILDAFAGLTRRVVVRPTYIYNVALQQAAMPEALKSAAAQGIALEQLSRSYLVYGDLPITWPLLGSELGQIESLDIPYFDQRIDSDDLHLPGGAGSVRHFALKSGLAASRSRFEQLSEPEIAFQLQLIQGTIEACGVDPHTTERMAGDSRMCATPDGKALSSKWRLEEALRLAAQLRQRRFDDHLGRPAWLGLDLGEDQVRFQFGVVGPSLNSGRSGIALFLALLAQRLAQAPEGSHVQASEFGVMAHEVMTGVIGTVGINDAMALSRWVRDQPLGMVGIGGVLLSLVTLQRMGFSPPSGSYLAAAAALTGGLCAERIQADGLFDMLGGCAGLIGPLLRLADIRGETDSRRHDACVLAAACGDHLLAHQEHCGAWTGRDGRRPLTGFSHGAAGIAASLARLHAATGLHRFKEGAARALSYERGLFSSAHGNWPDFRATEQPDQFMNSWCHGAPGIALSRLCLIGSELWDATSQEEVRVALTTAARDDGRVDHLCCGNLGRAAVLHIAACRGVSSGWSEHAVGLLSRTIAGAHAKHGAYRLFDVEDGEVFLPGLFTGQAGIGMALLAFDGWEVLGECLSCGCMGATNPW